MSPIRLTIPSIEVFLEPVQIFIEKVGLVAGVEEDELTSLSIAVLELVKNGMEHGNGMCGDKPVDIDIEVLPGRLLVQVSDTGVWKPEGDLGYHPGEGEQLFSDRGRGILIARNLARWVEFGLNEEGNTRVSLTWPLT